MATSARPGTARIGAVERPKSESLRRVQSGEMTLDEYLDERTERALDHVRNKVSAEILETVRATVRAQLEHDPLLIELVERATGKCRTIRPEDHSTDKRS